VDSGGGPANAGGARFPARLTTTITSRENTTATARKRRVLGVDDDPVMRRLIEGYLRGNGYEVTLAASVSEARAALTAQGAGHFDCIITDFNMPGETGLDLLAWLKVRDPEVAAIMITAAGERQIIAESLRAGASNFLDKPMRLADLLKAVDEGSALTERRRDASKSVAEVRDVGRAHHRMISRLHRSGIGGLQMRHFPQHDAGGDFAVVFPLADRGALLIAADVSGHDIRAAFVSAYFQGLARGLLESNAPASRVLAQVNDYLVHEWNSDGAEVPTSLSVTAIQVDRSRGRAVVHNHGAPPVHHVSADGDVDVIHAGGGSPLGWFEDSGPGAEAEIPLDRGGWLAVWTDGLEEHAAKLGVDPWALAGVLQSTDEAGGRPEVLADAPDDIMLLWFPLGENAGAAPLWRPAVSASYHGGQAAEIDALQAQWELSLRLAAPGLSDDRICEVVLCLREAVLNALVHGCGGSRLKRAQVSIRVGAGTGAVRVLVDDPGNGHDFDWKRHTGTAAEQLDGRHRGLAFLNSFPSSISVGRNGASISMDFEPENTGPTPSSTRPRQ
jgi:CheY-like chemotaxis protein/anti-sigma regulatory factor (Ser/Thr protein kinase)